MMDRIVCQQQNPQKCNELRQLKKKFIERFVTLFKESTDIEIINIYAKNISCFPDLQI